MKNIATGVAAFVFAANPDVLWACAQCRPSVTAGIRQNFISDLCLMLLPVAVILAVGYGLYFSDSLGAKLRQGVGRWQTILNVGR